MTRQAMGKRIMALQREISVQQKYRDQVENEAGHRRVGDIGWMRKDLVTEEGRRTQDWIDEMEAEHERLMDKMYPIKGKR